MDAWEPFASLGVAAAAGLLIGLEREQALGRDGSPRGLLAGARTHPIVALLGGLSMLLGRELGWAAPIAAFAVLAALLVVSYATELRTGHDPGLTSEAAFLVSFFLGALSLSTNVVEPASRRLVTVAAVAVVTTLLLSSKPRARAFAARVSDGDVAATVKFLIVAVVVLPLLPDRPFGPWGVLNARDLGLLVALIAGLSFVGYAAVRIVGPERGLALTGLVGGLASSTAVTLSMSSRAREEPRLARACALAVALASTVMVVRVGVVVWVVNRDFAARLAAPLGAMTLAGVAACGFLHVRARRDERGSSPVSIANPFELATALKFALLFAAVLVGSRAASEWLGAAGTYVAGILAGTTDVDAISLSMARLAGGDVPSGVAAASVFLGVASNTVVKAGMATTLGGWRFGRSVAAAFAVMLAAGAVGLLIGAGG